MHKNNLSNKQQIYDLLHNLFDSNPNVKTLVLLFNNIENNLFKLLRCFYIVEDTIIGDKLTLL